MQYFALLIGQERELTPDERAAEVWRHTRASMPRPGRRSAPATRCCRQPTGVRITRRPRRADGHRRPLRRGRRSRRRLLRVRSRKPRRRTRAGRATSLLRRRGAVEVRPIFHTLDAEWSNAPGAQWLALLLEPPAARQHPRHTGVGGRSGAARRIRRWRRAITSSAARRCTSRRRRRPCGFATARCCSPTGRSRRAPRSPRASTCCPPPTATRPSSWRR